MRSVLVALTVVVLLGFAGPALAQASGPTLNHCVFEWDEAAVAENDLASFNVYIGATTGGPYALVGSVAAPSPAGGAHYVSPNMCASQANGQKYAVVTALDSAGNESPRSTEIPFVFNGTPPPAVTGGRVR